MLAGHDAEALHDPQKEGALGQDRLCLFGAMSVRSRRMMPDARASDTALHGGSQLVLRKNPREKERHCCRETASTLCDNYS